MGFVVDGVITDTQSENISFTYKGVAEYTDNSKWDPNLKPEYGTSTIEEATTGLKTGVMSMTIDTTQESEGLYLHVINLSSLDWDGSREEGCNLTLRLFCQTPDLQPGTYTAVENSAPAAGNVMGDFFIGGSQKHIVFNSGGERSPYPNREACTPSRSTAWAALN